MPAKAGIQGFRCKKYWIPACAGMTTLLARFISRNMLRPEISVAAGDAVFIRPAINGWNFLKIFVRERRRRAGPLERGGLPGILFRFGPSEDAVEEIYDERNLKQKEENRAGAHEDVERLNRDVVDLNRGVVKPPLNARQTLNEHGEENAVHRENRPPEVNKTPFFVELSPEHLWKPVIDPAHEGDHGARDHDVVEMTDDIISVVKVNVRRSKSQGKPGQTPDPKQRKKGQSEKHGEAKADGRPFQAQEKARND